MVKPGRHHCELVNELSRKRLVSVRQLAGLHLHGSSGGIVAE
jgi:hypothetical protein